MKRLVAVLGAVLMAALAVVVPSASAQDGDALTRLQVRSVNSRDASSVTLIVDYTGDQSDLESATIVENGTEVDVDVVAPIPGSRIATILAVDTSTAMDAEGALVQTREALAEYIRNRPEGQEVGIVSFGGTGRVVQRLTNNTERLLSAVDGLAPTGGSALWNGLHIAAGLLQEAEGQQRNIIVIAGGPNDSSTIPGSRARGAVVSAEAAVYALGLQGRGINPNELRSVIDAAGGSYRGQENPSAIGAAMGDIVTELNSQYLLTFSSANATGPVDLTLEVGGQSTSVSYVAGGVATGASSLRPVEVTPLEGVGFLRDNGFTIGLVLAVLAAGLAVYAIGSLMVPDGGSLNSVLEAYTDTGTRSPLDDDDGSGMAKTAFIQRAVTITEGFAERQGVLTKIEGMLERANLPLRAAEALFFYACGVVLLFVLMFVVSGGNLVTTLVVGALIAILPPAVVNFLAGRRRKKFVSQLPDTLSMLSGTLRAGYSLMQGVEAISREVSEPMGQELRRIVTESRLGRPLEESMEASADRMQSDDFAWAVMAIRIQREVGGNLGELLMTVADTMIQRERLRRDIQGLIAEGKISAIVLGLLPIGLGVAMWMLNPEYIAVLFDTTLGNILLAGSIILAAVGFYWMKKVIEVDV
ncbi:MAG: type II secretion system F family protein [Acidimicrobiia bacterium]|nr:type II secretion system F family protein [Acidimicrobiia bacterium]